MPTPPPHPDSTVLAWAERFTPLPAEPVSLAQATGRVLAEAICADRDSPAHDVSAMDAVAIMGGFQDSKADPKGLLVLREYPASASRAGVRGPRQSRVVFSLDLTTADGLFSARRFQINPDDLVMATESPINDALTVSNVIGNFFGVFSAAGNI